MAEGKRYFWLKLKDDFFSSKRIKKLRKLAGGDTYLIIYLKMQLKALKTDGILQWTGLEDDFADELALDLDEEPDNVKVTLQFLLSCGLIESSDNVNFLLPYVAENTGSEGASAQRWRDWKLRQDEKTNVPQLPAKTNAERQRAYRAKQHCEKQQHIPFIDDHTNQKRYNGNYYLVCQRERYKCAMCGSIENLCVHHIDGFDESKPQNSNLNKMVLLCRSCHIQVHRTDGVTVPQEILDSIGYEDDSNVTANTQLTDRKQITNGEIEIEKEIDIEIEKEIEKKPKKFIPPTLEEVKAYVRERNSGVDPVKFWEYYSAGGWKDSKGNPVKNWKQKLLTWEKKDGAKEGRNAPVSADPNKWLKDSKFSSAISELMNG